MKISKEIKNQILADKDHLSIHQISKKYDLPRFEIERIINASGSKSLLNKKVPEWFYAVLFSLPIIFIIILEIFLRVVNYGYDFSQWINAGEGKYIINPNIGKKYFTSGDFIPTTNEDYFDIQKKSKYFQSFCFR